ncbi:MAG: peptidoglycan DD-metalloendopeptidase family protein [Pseudolabrys sp.]
MRTAAFVGLLLLFAGPAAADALKAPRTSVATVDWERAVADAGAGTPAGLDALNAGAERHFPGIAKSAVPVLLPLDTDGLRKDGAGNDNADRFVRAGFRATRFFLAGPGGYDAGFSILTSEVGELADIRYRDPVYVLVSGLRFTYELEGRPLPEGEPVKALEDRFPGIRRILHESYVRYRFERYGMTYVAAIYCRDTRPRPKLLTCKQADRIAERFIGALALAGGAPSPQQPVAFAPPERPAEESREFTYYSPGALIPYTGLTKDTGGRADYTVYARLRFPMHEAPAFANSQSFNNWGDCDFTGRTPRYVRKKGQPYTCKVNGLPLVFDESAGRNYAYPWRDNFCEHRRFFVGQCPGGEGHQGQDIRPGSCTLFNEGADRCEPYRHDIVAVHEGTILRARKQEAVYLYVNTPDTRVRVRYMHMNPNLLDADGVVSGRTVTAGEVIGKVANYNDYERGTTLHLHFDLQVPTRAGWVFVNPYMSLVSAYEQLIGARGRELQPGEEPPPAVGVPPIIGYGPRAPGAVPLPPVATQEGAAASSKAEKAKPRKKGARKKRRKKSDGDE